MMEQLKQWARKARPRIGGRRFAAALMCGITVSLALGISVKSRVVTVNDGTASRVVVTVHEDPYRVLDTAGVVLDAHDSISVDEQSDTIDVDRAAAVEVKADGVSTLLFMTEGTVKDALKQADVTVGKLDTLNHKRSAAVKDGMLIEVDRVAYEEYTVKKVVPYQTTYRYTGVLKPGVVKFDKAGQNGEKVITYRKVIVNGKVSETVKVGEKVTKKAVNQVMLKGSSYGTPISKAPFSVKLDSKNQPVNYQKKFSGRCTAYAAGSIGASGMRTGVGTIAVNPRQIPYGTKLWITSADGKFVYGYAVAADTGSFVRRGDTLADLYMGSYQECCWFGARNLNIYVIG